MGFLGSVVVDGGRIAAVCAKSSGQTIKVDAVLDAGVVAIKSPGATAIGVFGAERDINDERALVVQAYEPTPTATLNAGNYVVVSDLGDDRKVEKEIQVTAGKRLEVEVKP